MVRPDETTHGRRITGGMAWVDGVGGGQGDGTGVGVKEALHEGTQWGVPWALREWDQRGRAGGVGRQEEWAELDISAWPAWPRHRSLWGFMVLVRRLDTGLGERESDDGRGRACVLLPVRVLGF